MLLLGAAGGFDLQSVNLKDVEIYAHGVGQMDLRVFLKLFEELMNFNGDPIPPEIQVPTLIISGGKYNVTPQSFQRKFSLVNFCFCPMDHIALSWIFRNSRI